MNDMPIRAPSVDGGSAGLVLDVRELVLRFGGVTSLDGVSLRHERGQILAVIGPNGAGKTSLFNCLTGVYRPQSGGVTLWGRDGSPINLLGRRPHMINRLGLARTFQHTRLFGGLSALANVQIGVEGRERPAALRVMLATSGVRHAEARGVRRAMELLAFVGLAHRAHVPAATLAYGEQRRLEIARALGSGPCLLLVDEPAAGANTAEKNELAGLLRRIAADGISVMLIEHDMGLVMSVATDVVVLNFGRVIASGPPARVQRAPAVREAYLGTAAAAPADSGSDTSGIPDGIDGIPDGIADARGGC
ncbi:ABC transporter ATP-binding protein [Frankia sp. Cj5]|uniref:ABC transporter ATP-binding protein n=1 Tax=Frankia sp. Cj5 TaxID=2880978 RepID=UPI00351D19D2